MDQTPFEKMSQEGVPKTSSQTTAAAPQKQDQDLPTTQMSPRDFHLYNRMATHMDQFHTHFRRTWSILSDACATNSRPQGMSLLRFLSLGEEFCHHLTLHHRIEEEHIFPVLAEKMPAFQEEEGGVELLAQHGEIHKGLVRLEGWLGECRRGEREVRLREMGGIMEGFGGILWRHLDEEVHELRAENMKKYWSPEEMRRLPM